MTREEHLRFCRICKNQVKDRSKGIICGITGSRADFDESCAFFNEDLQLRKETAPKPTATQRATGSLDEVGVIGNSASIEKRLANFIIDLISIMVFSIFIGGFLGGILGFADTDALDDFEAQNTLRDYLFGFVVITLYYAIFESLTGRSLAKYITKTKVIDLNGEKPDLLTILVRTLCRFIPFNAFSFLFYNGSGWHDRLSNTKVVDV